MHEAHTARRREWADGLGSRAVVDGRANGLIEKQKLVDADAPLIASEIAVIAANRGT
jgi:hypothetical protein